jgi:hypothetical protein
MSNNKLEEYGFTDMNDEKTAREYAKKILGYSDEEVEAMTYEGGSGKGTLKTVSGDKIVDGANDDAMRIALAKQTETQRITEEYD